DNLRGHLRLEVQHRHRPWFAHDQHRLERVQSHYNAETEHTSLWPGKHTNARQDDPKQDGRRTNAGLGFVHQQNGQWQNACLEVDRQHDGRRQFRYHVEEESMSLRPDKSQWIVTSWVLSIKEDVYVANKRNLHGEPYGFVRFSNVRDVTKLTKALNAVCFGHYRVCARVARFDRHDAMVRRRLRTEKGSTKDGGEGSVREEENHRTGEGYAIPGAGGQLNIGNKAMHTYKDNEQATKVYKYRSTTDDVQWAQIGMVAMVINGEAIPVVQNRIADAGFKELVIIPMGDDKAGKGSGDIPEGFLHADSCTIDKDRLDYARVLIATPTMKIVKRVETLLVDGSMVEIQIIEEWGYSLGEDACFF
ncbi:sulfate transporter, partial [Trifolium medium]|nr:sulfate transporter [Trifolium medium]